MILIASGNHTMIHQAALQTGLSQAASAGAEPGVNGFLIRSKLDGVLFRRQILAVRGVEYFGVFVADEHLSRRFRVFRDSILVGPGEGDFLPMETA